MLPKIFEKIPFYCQVRNFLFQNYISYLKKYRRQKYADHLFQQAFGKKIDWENPRDLNECINYLEFKTDTSIWSRLTDKIQVREYVRNKGLEDILIPLLGVWNSANEINFDSLPQKFVLKCNHDSGSTHIIDKSECLDKESIIFELNSCLSRKYGNVNNEPHYNRIKPQILAEEFISTKENNFSSSPIDYKIFCLNGEPDIIWVAYNRSKVFVNHQTMDLNWTRHPEFEANDNYYRIGQDLIPKPQSLGKMIEAARILAQGFPQVRVDFYDIDGRLFFGEMTFTSDCGRMPFFSKLYLQKAGKKIKLSTKKRTTLLKKF